MTSLLCRLIVIGKFCLLDSTSPIIHRQISSVLPSFSFSFSRQNISFFTFPLPLPPLSSVPSFFLFLFVSLTFLLSLSILNTTQPVFEVLLKALLFVFLQYSLLSYSLSVIISPSFLYHTLTLIYTGSLCLSSCLSI